MCVCVLPSECCRHGGTVRVGIWSRRMGRRPTHFQIDDCIGPKSLHGKKLKVTLEILGIQSGNRESVAKAGLVLEQEDKTES